MIKIGRIDLQTPILLAPMAGITDLPFRLIARSFGCEFAFLEMVSARSIVYQSGRTGRMLCTAEADRPLGAQLLGNEPSSLRKAVEKIQPSGFDVIDLNAACPVEKITKKGKGASLLRDPRKVRDLLRVLVSCADVPVTVKIRAGWDGESVNAREIALFAQDAGIHALTIHGRTRAQGYAGRVDYDVIREVKRALSVPVIASGDAFSPSLIKKMFDETGCDAVAIARGALGNPWIFRDTAAYLEKGMIPARPSPGEIADTMQRHLGLSCEFHGERKGTVIFRKHFAWYVKGLHDIRPLKEEAFQACTKEEISGLIGRVRNYDYRHAEGNYESYALSC